jgi:ubiquinone/menaquinone biosynthesis C-methylase UbiE
MNENHSNMNIGEEPYDTAFRWGWETPEFKELVYLCYKTPNFIENAHRYWDSPEFKAATRILAELDKKPGPQTKILDFGCGNGIASYALARAGYQVIGMDSSKGELVGINAAKKIQGLDGVHFELQHSTGEKMSFPDNIFDVVWMREVLHHINDLKCFLSKIEHILKPSGILCCLRDHVIWNEDQYKDFFITHPFHHITKDENCHYLCEYLTAFQEANLIIERVYHPYSTIINTYPSPYRSEITFDENSAKLRLKGNDIYSFFVRKSPKHSRL